MIDQSHVDEKETEEKEVERVTGWAKKPVYSTGPYPSVPRHYNSEHLAGARAYVTPMGMAGLSTNVSASEF